MWQDSLAVRNETANAEPHRRQSELDAQRKKQKPSQGHGIFAGIVIVVLGVLFVFVNNFMCKAIMIPGRRCCVWNFGIAPPADAGKAPVQSITNADGKPARGDHRAGLTSPDASLIKSMDNQRVTFVNGEATITVPDSYFASPKEINHNGNGFPVTLDMVILDNHRGNEVQVPCDPFTIEIPPGAVWPRR